MSWLNADMLRNRLLKELDNARESVVAAREKGDQRWLDKASGVEALARVLLLSYSSVWAGLPTDRKRALNPEREAAERGKRNALARTRRAVLLAKVAHLSEHARLNPSDADWFLRESRGECGIYLNAGDYSSREMEERCKGHRITKRMGEVTCRDCLDAAGAKGIAGAAERLRKLWRDEEREAADG